MTANWSKINIILLIQPFNALQKKKSLLALNDDLKNPWKEKGPGELSSGLTFPYRQLL